MEHQIVNTLYFHHSRYPSKDKCEYFPIRLATKLTTYKDALPLPFPNDFSKFIKLSTFYDYDYFSTMMKLIGNSQNYTYSTTGVLMAFHDGQSVIEYRENPALGLSGGIIRLGYEGEVGERSGITLSRLPTGLALHFKLGHHLTFRAFGPGAIQFETQTREYSNTATPYDGKIILDSVVTMHRIRSLRFRYEVEIFPDTSELPTLDPTGAKLYYIMNKKVTSK